MRLPWNYACLIGVVAAAVLLRSPHLTQRSVWFDEACSWRTARFPVAQMIRSNVQDVHPPLYFLILKCWMTVFGDSTLALRSLSVLFGALTVSGMYLFGRELHKQPAAWV